MANVNDSHDGTRKNQKKQIFAWNCARVCRFDSIAGATFHSHIHKVFVWMENWNFAGVYVCARVGVLAKRGGHFFHSSCHRCRTNRKWHKRTREGDLNKHFALIIMFGVNGDTMDDI